MNYTQFRAAIMLRDNYACARCGRRADTINHRNHHHRDNRASNAHAACGDGTTGCHGYIEAHHAAAEEWGWVVTRHGGPADTVEAKIWLEAGAYGRGWYRLDDDFGLAYLGAVA